jgi:hypothetical protein
MNYELPDCLPKIVTFTREKKSNGGLRGRLGVKGNKEAIFFVNE